GVWCVRWHARKELARTKPVYAPFVVFQSDACVLRKKWPIWWCFSPPSAPASSPGQPSPWTARSARQSWTSEPSARPTGKRSLQAHAHYGTDRDTATDLAQRASVR